MTVIWAVVNAASVTVSFAGNTSSPQDPSDPAGYAEAFSCENVPDTTVTLTAHGPDGDTITKVSFNVATVGGN